MIEQIPCWLVGHKFVVFVYVTDGVINIRRKDAVITRKELGRCTVCGYVEGEGDEVTWTGHLNYVHFSKDVLKYMDGSPFELKREGKDETK